jgi:two-component system phosphate regulon sensor histidine kinase PhoR
MRLDLLTRPAWQASLARFALLLAAAVAIGLIIGRVELALVVALFGYAVFSLASLYRLRVWLESRQRIAPPGQIGAWGEVSEFIHFRFRGARARQRRLVRLLRAFREAADALPDAVIVIDIQRRITWFNRSAGKLLRLRLARDRGKLVDDFLPNPMIRSWLSDSPEREPLLDVPSPADESRRLALRMMPYAADQRLLIVRDISQLARLEQVRRDFVANVSHELRTPLTVLHGYLDLIEPEEAPGFAPILEDLRTQSRRMAQIVEDLLTLSRLEAPQALADEPVIMSAMIAALRRDAEGLSRSRHQVDVGEVAAVNLIGSPQYLHSAFSNLVSNAVRYTPNEGRITIAWRVSPDGSARFTVSDTGYGIPAEHIPRITERFYRVSTSRSRALGGTGLGLSIVKHVLALHGARLEIESEVGRGSTFACVFGPERVLIASAEPTSAAATVAP